MNSDISQEDVFDGNKSTPLSAHEVSSTEEKRRDIKGVPAKLENLLNVQLPALLRMAIMCGRYKENLHRVDGRIIGTGEADFTKENTCYTLNYKGRVFQLVDVPGIEGDESKYAHVVREAVAKAHLVIYVNGTNKKPEKATAEKISSYLRHGTQVFPLVNVRGNADAYEFEEDRESLSNHAGGGAVLKQTMDVLESVLDKDVLLTGHSVHGLLAFSSLALDSASGKTTIYPSREKDLVIQQRNYLKYFKSARAMLEFSQIASLAKVLQVKQATFKEDIVESNKAKVQSLLVENIKILYLMLEEHQEFIARVKPEFEKCREAIDGAVASFERLITEARKNLWRNFFARLTEKADAIVEDNFGEEDRISVKLKRTFQSDLQSMQPLLQKQAEREIQVLQESIDQTMKRLIQDVQCIEFQQRIVFAESGQNISYYTPELDMKLSLKEWGVFALNIGSYALAGAGLGSAFPVIGNMIGGILGGLGGLFSAVVGLWSNKGKRIREAQMKVQERIDEMCEKAIGGVSDELSSLMENVRAEIDQTVFVQIDDIYASLSRPLDVIQRQIAILTNVKNKIEGMPYGKIQAI